MASQVLSGSSNVSYTNNTGQNVRIVINYMETPNSMSWAGVTKAASSVPLAIGRNLAFNNSLSSTSTSLSISSNNGVSQDGSEQLNFAFPTEIMIASGQTFSATCSAYNIVVIPEAG